MTPGPAPGPTTVILLAGSRAGADPVATAAGVSYKALAPVAGRPMIEHVLATFRAMPEVERLIVIGPEALRSLDAVADAEAEGWLTLAEEAPSPARSVMKGLENPDTRLPALVTTADSPLLTAEIVRHFWQAADAKADVAVAVADGAAIRRHVPEGRRTFLRFRDGDVSGCNLFAMMTPEARRIVAFWQRLEDHRKSPLTMASMLGPLVIAQYLLRRLSLEAAGRHISRKAGATGVLVRLPFPEAAVDVDKPEDVPVAERLLAARSPAHSA